MATPSCAYKATEYLMINSIKIDNFRCFKNLSIDSCRRVNVAVGPNGAGKTALLEAIFMPLANGSEITARMHQWRGGHISFIGSARDIELAMWSEYFNQQDMRTPVSISLKGTGLESRSISISRIGGSLVIPKRPNKKKSKGAQKVTGADQKVIAELAIKFEWTDAKKQKRAFQPILTSGGLALPGSPETAPDSYFFASAHPTNSAENATRFSDLGRRDREGLIAAIRHEYPLIQNLIVESRGGAATLCAELSEMDRPLPLTTVSSSISRTVAMLLAIASRPKSIVIVDEIENGVYYKNYESHSRLLLKFANQFDAQLILTTHSDAWLDGLITAAGDKSRDLALWRLDGHGQIEIVDGEALRDTRTYGGEIR